jgi:CheY-like chemotaxis protein/HPt (histidine-containing phosphotransfer) domain-containing protein
LRIVLLSSVKTALRYKGGNDLGISEVLGKPVRQERLLTAVARALGRAASPVGLPALEHPASSAQSRIFAGRHVLLAEDNEINREVALGMLTALGCIVKIAEHGAASVDRYSKQRWDVVLMDCQMPIMDGFAAVAEIRTLEARHRLPRVPIIALTANAMEGDRERCLAADMDDFVRKPFTSSQLQSVLAKWIGDASENPMVEPVTPADETVLDPAALDAIRAIPTPGLLNRMIRLYEEHTPRLILEGRAAIEARDCQRIAVAVHELKSSSANLGGHRVAQLCKECEAASREDDLGLATRLWQQIAIEYDRLRVALVDVRHLESAA